MMLRTWSGSESPRHTDDKLAARTGAPITARLAAELDEQVD